MSKKRALCVGINEYKKSPLSGCVNDANDWAELLAREGYEVTVLLDRNAQKSTILNTIRQMVSVARFGDRIVFTYSGHGTWLLDQDGDEIDGRDEALCPYDYEYGELLTDDELNGAFEIMSHGVGALILSDSCHSGTMSRFVADHRGDEQIRFVPPFEVNPAVNEERAIRLEREIDVSKPRRTASLISGCTDLEFSWDAWFGNRANGAFTRTAINTYESGISLKKWHDRIRKSLPSAQYQQTPQLSASAYRKYTRAL